MIEIFRQISIFSSLISKLLILSAVLVTSLTLEVVAKEKGGAVIEEIIVTATRRAESLQDIPLSVTAFTGDNLRSRGVFTSNDIARITPGLTVQTGFGITSPQIRVRGVGSAGFTAETVGAVGIYMDEVYLNSNIGHGFHLYDVERVEILRGPQGTLYGANTTGGAMNYIFKKPSGEFGAEASLSVGNFGALTVEGALEAPLTDELAFRASYYSNEIDGWGKNTFLNQDQDFYDLTAWRVQALYEPNEDLSILLRTHLGQNRGDSLIAEPVGTLDPVTGTQCSTQRRLNFECVDLNGYNIKRGFFDTATGTFTGRDAARDPFDNAQDHANRGNVDVFGFSGRVEWSVGGLDVVSISAYEELEREESFDIEGSSLDFLLEEYLADTEQFTQEVRVSNDASERFNWVVGAFYLHEEVFDQYALVINSAFGVSPRPTGEYAEARRFDLTTNSASIFADVSYDLTEKLTLSGGLRFSWEKKETDDYHNRQIDTLGTSESIPISPEFAAANEVFTYVRIPNAEESWEEFTGRIALEFRPNNNWLTYVSATRGFRGGTIPAFEYSAAEWAYVNPEFVDSYEIGVKGSFWDQRGVFNIAGFYMDYTDQQVQSSINAQTILSNAGASTIYGSEMELQLLPVEGLSLNAGMALLSAEFDELTLPGGGDGAGNKLESSPEVSFNGIGRYEFPFYKGNMLALQFDANYQSEVFLDIGNSEESRESGYWIFNTNVSYIADKYELSAWVKNIGDERYRVNWFDVAGLGFLGNWYGDPRSYGVTLSIKLD